jgi:hypothetical protein
VGRQNKSERFGEHINLLLIPGIEPRFLGRSIRSLVPILTPFMLLRISGLQNCLYLEEYFLTFCHIPMTKGTLSLFLLVHF